jgi:hypothetical protein
MNDRDDAWNNHVCVYCSLRTSRVLRRAGEVVGGDEPKGGTPGGPIKHG